VTVTAFISSQRAEHQVPVRLSCRALGVSESWYFKHRDRTPTPAQSRRAALAVAVTEAFEASGGTYGSPRVTLELQAAGWRVSVNTVAALMREQGLVARVVRRRRSLTRQGHRPAAADLVGRNFTAERPDSVWVGDVTMIRTGEGPLYLATVLDLFSRRLLGYATSAHHDAELTTASLQMAAAARGGDVAGVIFHSDRGSEYTAADYAAVCARLGVVQSMGRVASALDNAAAEAVNSILKTEYVYRNSFAAREQARLAVGRWIDRFYNARRRHSWCGGISPIQYEHQYKINTAGQPAAA
jgi:putative transposase